VPRPAYSPFVTLPYTLFVAVLVPVYWVHYGPSNFLWFSDIALFAVLIALWRGGCLLHSMMAVGVLPLEVAWTVDFLMGGQAIGLAAYMFDAESPLYLRALSLFHLFLPPLIVWMLVRQGYDRRALVAQTGLAWLVLPATRLLTAPEDNINWVYGLSEPGQTFGPPLVYLALFMVALPVLVYLPMHFLLKRLCSPCRALG
jgi:hypothetical protein